MPRPFNRRQALENQAFLAALRRTGNARPAARELGVHRSTFSKRRARYTAFAAEWDAALALAHARLREGSPVQPLRSGETEPHVIRLANGRLQLRAPAPGVPRIDRAAGFAHSSFYRLRDYDPAFAREMRMALEMGYERIEMALLESFREDAWRHNDPPAIPPMTAGQAMQLLYLHQKEARLWSERPDRRRRRGESTDRYSARLGRKWRAEKASNCEGYEVARAIQGGGEAPEHLEPAPPVLPALEQVTGWSKARPELVEGADPGKTPHHPDLALFGGWRLEDWKGRT